MLRMTKSGGFSKLSFKELDRFSFHNIIKRRISENLKEDK